MMISIQQAKDIIDKTHFSNYEDFNTYPKSVFTCNHCGDKVGFAFRDLEKHRFSKYSNLNANDEKMMGRLMLSLIPKYKLKQKRQIWALTNLDRLIIRIQRLYLRSLGVSAKFPKIPTTKENIPDSFIDFYCPTCNNPIRIYYFSFIGCRHVETGFILKYILN